VYYYVQGGHLQWYEEKTRKKKEKKQKTDEEQNQILNFPLPSVAQSNDRKLSCGSERAKEETHNETE
jgi:hypothetical protein